MTTQSRGENVDRVFQELTKHDTNVVQHLYAEASYAHPNTVNFWRKIIYALLLDHGSIKFNVADIQEICGYEDMIPTSFVHTLYEIIMKQNNEVITRDVVISRTITEMVSASVFTWAKSLFVKQDRSSPFKGNPHSQDNQVLYSVIRLHEVINAFLIDLSIQIHQRQQDKGQGPGPSKGHSSDSECVLRSSRHSHDTDMESFPKALRDAGQRVAMLANIVGEDHDDEDILMIEDFLVSIGKGVRSTDQRLIKVALPGISNKTRASLGASPSSSATLASPASSAVKTSPSSSAVKASPSSSASTPSPTKLSTSFHRVVYPGKVTENDIAQFNLHVSINQLQTLVQNLHTKSTNYKQQALTAKHNNNLTLARSRLQLYKATEAHANKAEQALCNLQDAQDRMQQATWNNVVVEAYRSATIGLRLTREENGLSVETVEAAMDAFNDEMSIMHEIEESISEGGMSMAGVGTGTGASDEEDLYEELEQLMNEMAISSSAAIPAAVVSSSSSVAVTAAGTATPATPTPATATTASAVVISSSEEKEESTQSERRVLTTS